MNSNEDTIFFSVSDHMNKSRIEIFLPSFPVLFLSPLEQKKKRRSKQIVSSFLLLFTH